jgi:hypothetical protein
VGCAENDVSLIANARSALSNANVTPPVYLQRKNLRGVHHGMSRTGRVFRPTHESAKMGATNDEEPAMPKFLLLMNYGAEGVEPMTTWAQEDIKAHIDFQHALGKELTDNGELVDAQGLAGPELAKTVTFNGVGAPVVTDGPFPEYKEFLAGYWLVDLETPERAIEIAAKASAAPGPSGVPISQPIEVREVMIAVIRRFGDFAAAEDAVQEALLAAAMHWPQDGLPDNPRGWLIQVAVRQMTDQIRSEQARRAVWPDGAYVRQSDSGAQSGHRRGHGPRACRRVGAAGGTRRTAGRPLPA